MKERTRQELGTAIAEVIGQVLRDPWSFGDLSNIADSSGYSQFHFARCFRELTGETPVGFLRRIRLEQAAYRLRNGERVNTVSESLNNEAFTKAFSRAYGSPPTRFKKDDSLSWKLPSPHDLHWIPEWDPNLDSRVLRARYPVAMHLDGPKRLAVVRRVRSYARLDSSWESLLPLVQGWNLKEHNWATVYHDSMYTTPTSDEMRADLGFELPSGPAPKGFKILEIPRGRVIKTTDYVARSQRNEAWTYLTAQWPNVWGWDEYPEWPLPFDKVRTRVCLLTPGLFG